MFEVFKRISTVVKSELHATLDNAEDPIHMIDQYLREMNQEIVEAERSTAKMMAEEKLLGKKVSEFPLALEKREEQAKQALGLGREDLARAAIENKLRIEKEQSQVIHRHVSSVEQVQESKENLFKMKEEYKELELKRDDLYAREKAAKAKLAVNRSYGFTTTATNQRNGFSKMEAKINRLEAEADTSKELYQESRSFEKQLDDISKNIAVEEELKRLKESMNKVD